MEGEKSEAQTKNEAPTPPQIATRLKVEHLLPPLKSPANSGLNLQMEEIMKEEVRGERSEMQTKNEALTPPKLATRFKVEHLLSSLKFPANRDFDLQMEEMLKKEIADLMMQLVRERLNNKRMNLYGSFELLVMLLFLFTFFMRLVSGSL